MAKAYNGLRNHVSIVEMVSKHIWIIPFEAWTKKRRFGSAGPVGTGQAGSQTSDKLFKCKIGLHHCVPLAEQIKKHIWFALFEVRMN